MNPDPVTVTCSLRTDFTVDGTTGDGTYVLGLATTGLGGGEVVVAASLSNHRIKLYKYVQREEQEKGERERERERDAQHTCLLSFLHRHIDLSPILASLLFTFLLMHHSLHDPFSSQEHE